MITTTRVGPFCLYPPRHSGGTLLHFMVNTTIAIVVG